MKKLNMLEWIKGSLLALTALAVATGITVSAVNHAKSTLVVTELQACDKDHKKDEHKSHDKDHKKDEHKSHDDHKDDKHK